MGGGLPETHLQSTSIQARECGAMDDIIVE
jgi:hypothetical protein